MQPNTHTHTHAQVNIPSFGTQSSQPPTHGARMRWQPQPTLLGAESVMRRTRASVAATVPCACVFFFRFALKESLGTESYYPNGLFAGIM